MNKPSFLDQTRQFLATHHPSAFLLAAQLLQLALYAVFDGVPGQRAVVGAVGGLVLMLVVWVVDRSPAVNWVAWMLAVPAFALTLWSAISASPGVLAWSALFEAGLYFYAVYSLVAYMMEDYQVTTDELFAVGATFTLLAWGFAYAYLALQVWAPDSFLSGVHPGQPFTFVELLSLSFTNLSATGLGDILPISATARVLVMLEQFSGVGYVAVVVSRLVGLTTQMRAGKRP